MRRTMTYTKSKECVAMLLAGGQGSRLYTLTDNTAKPAVSFGGKYRIIDFPLSNCINSGIDTVGVLTQYQPLALNEYIGNGGPWDLDRNGGGVTILPPYRGKTTGDWYRGTANAIYQNLNFISKYCPEYVLILSGDHIYKMNYAEMIALHRAKNAACTVAVLEVPFEEASRFGILSADEDGRITDFEEKPAEPKSNLASMGIYVFGRDILERYLRADEDDPESSNDFGKNIIPNMLRAGERMYSYRFDGYWRDVGTIGSLWQANMDLIGSDPDFRIGDRDWRIYSRNYAFPPQFVGSGAEITDSVLTEGCEIYGKVIRSVLSNGVIVEHGAVVCDSVIMSGCRIGKGARVEYAVIDSGCDIGDGARVGGRTDDTENGGRMTVIGANSHAEAGSVIEPGEMLTNNSLRRKGVNR